MYCNNCGKEIDNKAAVCPYCGVYTNNKPATNNETNSMATIGFILSFFIAIAGLICSIIGYKRAATLNGNGKGLALAGIIISAISIIVTIIAFIILIGGLAAIATL